MSGAQRPAAVVLGLGLNGLGIVRSLAKAPFPLAIHAFDSDLAQPGAYTRYATKHRSPPLDSPALIETLVTFGRQQATSPVLFITQEKTAELVSAHRDALEPHFRLLLPLHAVLGRLMNKTSFHACASAAGFPVPRTVTVQAPDDLEQARDMPLPCILKPAQRDVAYERRFNKAYRVASFAELVRLTTSILPVTNPLIVQEWIEGGDSAIFFCLQFRSRENGNLAHFTGRKIRSWPPAVGGTASCTAAPDADPDLRPLTDRFFAATGAVGLVSMEYKLDARSGRYLMVEPTVGRSDYQEEVATLNGVNIPLAAYTHLAALDPPPVLSTPPVIWRDPVADTRSARSGGEDRMPPGKVVDAYYRLADPGPALARLAAPLRRRAKLPPEPPSRPGGSAGTPHRGRSSASAWFRNFVYRRVYILNRGRRQAEVGVVRQSAVLGFAFLAAFCHAVPADLRRRRQTPEMPNVLGESCGNLSARVRSWVLGFVRSFLGFDRRSAGFARPFPGSFSGSFVGKRAKSVDSCAISNANGAYSGEDYDKLVRIAVHHVYTYSV
jgi:D-aspartate ligase